MFVEGQRWISETEPELGLGTVVQVSTGRVQVLFTTSGEMRMYAADHAPLKRVQFRPGDTISTHDGEQLTVESVQEQDGLLVYTCDNTEVPEALLSDAISFQTAEDRLLNGHIDSLDDYQIRARTLDFQHHRKRSTVRGFVGGRIDLIPHQLFIAHEVSSRQAPRVLLSDEVGLGKTIEACLILHRMLLTGRASRILIVVPDSLVHQWFIEMLRRFNIWMHIYDEERCAAVESGAPEGNPFLDDQLILCSLQFLASSGKRALQALQAGWDVLVVDEAHHLQWSPEASSPEYAVIDALSQKSKGLLLLTATPEQLGVESHFARLRLLDPDRYSSYESFKNEPDQYKTTADLIEKLTAKKKFTTQDHTALTQLFAHDKDRIKRRLAAINKGNEDERKSLINDTLDLHGPGRVIFRNTRSAMSGFPKRRVHLAPLHTLNQNLIAKITDEFVRDAQDVSAPNTEPVRFGRDDRINWLIGLLQSLDQDKVLLICRSKEKALALHDTLRQRINLKAAVFHEDLSLVQRDRNAAWFAQDDGARLLICSEIGSEGRNFQFAHHLVLFDLPLNPELLEQRIGRLDRIGQTETINIHVLYVLGTPQEVLGCWYHAGLNAFETSLEGGNALFQQFGETVFDVAQAFPGMMPRERSHALASLTEETRVARDALQKKLEHGRDRLLELNSFRPDTANQLVRAIQREDKDPRLQQYMFDVFEHFDVACDELSPGVFRLRTQPATSASFSSVSEEGMMITFDRALALSREDIAFLSIDHPLVTEAMDLVLGSEKGNSSFALWPDPHNQALLLELRFVLETVADQQLHVDRFLPATPIRVLIDQALESRSSEYPAAQMVKHLRGGNSDALLAQPVISQEHLPNMIDAATAEAEARAASIIGASSHTMQQFMDHEIDRLRMLQQVNNNVRTEEIEQTIREKAALTEAIQQARIRLDAMRLIWKGLPL